MSNWSIPSEFPHNFLQSFHLHDHRSPRTNEPATNTTNPRSSLEHHAAAIVMFGRPLRDMHRATERVIVRRLTRHQCKAPFVSPRHCWYVFHCKIFNYFFSAVANDSKNEDFLSSRIRVLKYHSKYTLKTNLKIGVIENNSKKKPTKLMLNFWRNYFK